MAWNLHPFCFEKLDEVLKDSLVLPLSSCRSIKFLESFTSAGNWRQTCSSGVESLSLSHVSTISILSKFLVADLLSFLLLISMAWNLHPFCFEKLDEVLKDSLVLPLSSCRPFILLISMAWNLHPFYFEKLDEVLKESLVLPLSCCRCGVSLSLSLSLSHVSTISILSKFLVADLLSFLLLISMAWNLHPFCFEKLDEVLKDSLVLPLSSCRSVQPKMLFFALHLNHDTAESARSLHPFCFEKLDEVLKDSLVLPLSSCRNGYLRKGRKTKPKRQNRTQNGKAWALIIRIGEQAKTKGLIRLEFLTHQQAQTAVLCYKGKHNKEEKRREDKSPKTLDVSIKAFVKLLWQSV
ncbi:hypothetical protein Tco_0758696 [Tanacetum coccineum]